jgi:drug/metabolite transporter (DMT)-like permease
MGRRTLPEIAGRRVLRDTGADTVRGILLVNVCFFLLTVGDVATILALPVAGVVGAMLGRGAIGGLMVAALAVRHPGDTGRPAGLRRLWPVRWQLVLFRSIVHALATLTWYIAWQHGMELAGSYALAYAAPLLMILLAVPMVGERLGLPRVAATAVGFLGMLVMLRPGGDLWTPLSALVLLGVAGMAVSRIMARVLATTETPECLAFWLMALHVPIGLLMLGLDFPMPGVSGLALLGLLVLGLSNGVAHWLHSRASALAPVGALAPYEYTGMIWAVPLGYLTFAQVPSWTTLGGAAVVAAAGMFNFGREHRRRRAERTAPVADGPIVVAAPALAQRSDQ